jgi:hypothetical protein
LQDAGVYSWRMASIGERRAAWPAG